jgi:diguanylate cyclase (GGDEF)-like protein
MPDGALVPAEITLARVKGKDGYIVVAYTRDLRDVKKLETEASKIYVDALTGIYNRRFLDEKLQRIIRSLSRYNGKLSLMMVDIDYFKKYNDTYGHLEGDNCLKTVAETLTESVRRADDVVVRYGGEEFVIVLPNTDDKGACVVADKLLANMRNRGIPHAQSDVAEYVTVSAGITTSNVHHTQSGDDYIKRADEMLYQSKQNGRDRYTFGAL